MVRNAAYPVFTGASCDTKIDFIFSTCATKVPGQVNGYFRWRNVSDTGSAVALELRMVSAGELKSKFFTPPASATAEVAIRRLQEFRVRPGDKVSWLFGAQKGTATVGKDGLLSVGTLTITDKPQTLRVTR